MGAFLKSISVLKGIHAYCKKRKRKIKGKKSTQYREVENEHENADPSHFS